MDEKESRVRIMTNSEKNDFDGITIEEDTGKEESRYSHGRKKYSSGRILFHTMSWKDLFFSKSGWLTRLAVLLAVLAIAGFFLFAVMPIVLIMLAIGVVVWLLMNLFFS